MKLQTCMGLSPAAHEADVLNYLAGAGVLNQSVLQSQALCLQRAGNHFYECAQCRRVHLHAAGGICTECFTPLGNPQAR